MKLDLYGDPIAEEVVEEKKKDNYFFMLFDSITNKKSVTLESGVDFENVYEPYIINTSLSQSADSIMYVNDMNNLPHLPKRLQYEYFINTIRSRSRRIEKFLRKSAESDDLEIVKEYYNCSNQKAKDALLILSEDELDYIRSKTYKGGKENDK